MGIKKGLKGLGIERLGKKRIKRIEKGRIERSRVWSRQGIKTGGGSGSEVKNPKVYRTKGPKVQRWKSVKSVKV